jgi:hypothetical protein
LFTVWKAVGSSAEFEQFYDDHLVKIAVALTYQWRDSGNESEKLLTMLGMWGVLSRFSKSTVHPPLGFRTLPAMFETERAFAASAVMPITSLFGMIYLRLRFSPSMAARMSMRLSALRTKTPDVAPADSLDALAAGSSCKNHGTPFSDGTTRDSWNC